MKVTVRIVAVLALATALAPSRARGVDGVVHYGHNGDVRAVHAVGGVLWIGTGNGVFRYDLGSDEFAAHTEVGEVLASNSVHAIASRGDSVFVGTDGGLTIFDGPAAHVYAGQGTGAYDSLTFDDIRSIDFGRDDTVYLGTYGHGLGVMTPDGGRMITRSDSLLDNKVYGVAENWTRDEDGELLPSYYYATSMGLCAWRDSAWVGFQAGAGIPRGQVRRIFQGDGVYYLLVGLGGVYRFDGHHARDISPRGVLPQDDIADMTRDERGVLWVAGRFGGFAVYQGGNWRRIVEGDEGVNTTRWTCLDTDGEGGVFAGSADGIVAVIRDNILRLIDLPAGLPAPSARALTRAGDDVFALSGERVVRLDRSAGSLAVEDNPPGFDALAVDGTGALWAGGRWGIFKRTEDGGYNEFIEDTGAVEPAFTALVFDDASRLWAATRAGAVYRYDGELWLRVGERGEVLGGSVEALRVQGGSVWAVAPAGVSRFDGRRWTSFSADSLGGEVRDLAAGLHGAVVVATPRRVWLYRADTSDWQAVGFGGDGSRAFVAPASRTIRSVAFDGDGRLYLGTDTGLALVGASGVRWLGARDGIGGGAVSDLLVDGDDAIWVGFERDGLCRIPLKSLW